MYASLGKNKTIDWLWTVPPLFATTKDDDKNKPAIYKQYDFSKGGTDIVDQRMEFYSCKLKSKRWTINAFFCVLDIYRVNASTIYATTMICSLEIYRIEKATYSIHPHIEKRSLIGINSSLIHKIETVLGKKYLLSCTNVKWIFSHQREKRWCCDTCTSQIKGAKEKQNFKEIEPKP